MAGTSLGARFYRQIKRHPALIPMIGFIGLGMGSAALYLLRLALRSPDVCWDRKNNPEPWNRLSPNDQYKVPPDGPRATPPCIRSYLGPRTDRSSAAAQKDA
ncbi:NADH dehydrogenase [ubiquinone] 1 alpha subcomplex subunit 4-like 2 isoform X1 [Choloepus didactylus]|uniref:NADH dehydrogenase [ubiquinone] 1 alpha subcomplex subunit 4-like 2 isoform X1 n=1 Tax=Choloepus didactylus TaxID=27675 RepID=UPI00189EE455|nr:NADH dehydrogenase [ubiquinone] 1 alpha subcomplex subunit 4-like 2 isoform X1 [Choloepus didactylus]